MYRFLVRTAIFTVIIGLSLYIGAQWKLKQDLEQIDKQLGHSVKFSYESSALTLTGKVIIGGVDLFFPSQDLNISINKVEFSTGSIFDMAFLSSQFQKKAIPEYLSYSLNEVVIPLTPQLVRLIASTEQRDNWNYLSAVGCGRISRLGFNQYFAMGYDYLVFSADATFELDDYNGNMIGSGHIDIDETSLIDYKFNIANIYESQKNDLVRNIKPSIESMAMSILDKGYNRHRNEYCALKAETTTELYLERHINGVKKKFESAGIKVTPTGIRAYNAFLKPSSRVDISIKPQASFSLADFGFYDESELRDILGLKLSINEQSVGPVFRNWSHDKYSEILFIDSSDNDNVPTAKRFENIVVHRRYEQEPIDNIGNFVGQQVKIIREDGKQYLGELNSIENDRVFVSISRDGGVIKVSVETARITRLDILRKN